MTGIFELCRISGFSNNGMADSWSEEVTAGSGGCSTYCAKCDGALASADAGAARSDSDTADCAGDSKL